MVDKLVSVPYGRLKNEDSFAAYLELKLDFGQNPNFKYADDFAHKIAAMRCRRFTDTCFSEGRFVGKGISSVEYWKNIYRERYER